VSFDEDAVRIMIFLSEDDRHHHHGLHEVLLNKALESGIVGASVWRGIEGFGPSGRVRTLRFPDANTGLPLVVEVIDSAERVEEFLSTVSELAPGSLVTKEAIRLSRTPPVTKP
jgi:PII-like signaling protein